MGLNLEFFAERVNPRYDGSTLTCLLRWPCNSGHAIAV